MKIKFIKIVKTVLISVLALYLAMQGSFALAKHEVVGPVYGKISSVFGMRIHPIKGEPLFHSGIDIAADSGTPIFAIQDGTVIFSGTKGGYGNCIILDHYYPDVPQIPRLQTLYGHNSTLLVNEGSYVKRGQVIAYVGSTGTSTGPHLHFEVRYNNMYVNPIDYLYKLPSYLDYVALVRSKTRYTSYNSINGKKNN